MKQTTNISALAPLAAEAQAGRMKLFNKTELANIPHTKENLGKAVDAVRFLTSQTRSLVQLAVVHRGMYMCWLKTNYTQHGEWEKFCRDHFPDIPKRTRQYWMAAYLIDVGEKKPRELPAYDRDELEDGELADAVESLSTDKVALAPRKALLDHIVKLEKNQKKGLDDRQKDRDLLETKDAEIERLKAGAAIPEHIKNETQRVEYIRNQFWSFVRSWITNLPDSAGRMKLHRALLTELTDEMAELWENHIFPQAESRITKAKKSANRKGG